MLIGFGWLLISFQNCSSGFSQNDLLEIASKAAPSENGHGYGGKPDSGLYRFVPNYSCGSQAVAPEIIQWNGTGEYILVKTDFANACQQTKEPIDKSLLNFSIFQNEFLSYNSFLFTAVEGKVEKPPEKLAEALCRDNFENPKLEIIAHYNGVEQKAEVQFYGTASSSAVGASAVARLFSQQSVVYKTNLYSIEIALATTMQQGSNRFTGILQTQSGQQTLTCILGGGLDIGLFSINKVVSEDVEKKYTNDLNQSQAFFELPVRSGQYLFQKTNQKAPSILDQNGQVTDLQENLMADCEVCRYLKLNFAKNQFVTYGFDKKNAALLYAVDLDGQRSAAIDFNPEGLQDYWVLKNAAYFFVKNSIENTYSLISYHLEKKITRTLLANIAYDFSFQEAVISKKNNVLLIYAKKDSRIPLLVVNDAINSAKIVTAKELGLPTKVFDYYHSYNVWGQLVDIANPPNMLFTMRESLDISNFDTDIYFFNPIELTLKKQWSLPAFFSRHILGNGQFLLGCNTRNGFYADCTGHDDTYLNLKTGEKTSFSAGQAGVPNNFVAPVSQFISLKLTLKIKRFSESNAVLYGGGVDYGRQYGFKIDTKERQALCLDLNNDIFLSYFNSGDGATYQLAVNSTERSLSIIRMDGFNCRLQSKIPYGSWSTLSDFAVTAAGVALVFDSKDLGSERQHVIFAPFNGRTPILLNLSFKPFLSAEQILSSGDGGLIYLIGKDSETGLRNIFKFRPY